MTVISKAQDKIYNQLFIFYMGFTFSWPKIKYCFLLSQTCIQELLSQTLDVNRGEGSVTPLRSAAVKQAFGTKNNDWSIPKEKYTRHHGNKIVKCHSPSGNCRRRPPCCEIQLCLLGQLEN